MAKLNRTAGLTDIHFGAKNNSIQHNEDCINYLTWFCAQCKLHNVDNVIFLGDYHENRSAVSISTLTYSYLGAKMLNDLGIPVFFIIGNHDLYHRHTREIYSTIHFQEFTNFQLIVEPTVVKEIETSPLICPFLFPDEYGELVKYRKHKTWWGHFEFQGFVITGHSIKMPTGPDPKEFKGPKYIFSGHFHKRQQSGNICYIGNTFPTNFSDAGDNERGMMVYDHLSQDITFIDWPDCPQYIKTKISTILDDAIIIPKYSRIKCLLDEPITYEEHTIIKNNLMDTYQLREFTFEDEGEVITTDSEESDNDQLESIDELVIRMLNSINMPTIDNNKLIELYRRL